jgi:hypothetical protein
MKLRVAVLFVCGVLLSATVAQCQKDPITPEWEISGALNHTDGLQCYPEAT